MNASCYCIVKTLITILRRVYIFRSFLGSSENEEDVVNKYRALVSEIREKEKKSNSGTDMEVSWIPNDVVNEQVKEVKRYYCEQSHYFYPHSIFPC